MFDRLKVLVDDETFEKIINTNILLIGLGGVGGACFEALVRLGIKKITVVDGDIFDETNLNRQILATTSEIGNKKVFSADLRAKNINHDISVECIDLFLNDDNIDKIDFTKYQYVIDCCDTVSTKILLVEKAIQNKVKIISCMGTGNRFDPTKLEITNIWKTENDPLARVIRKLLRERNINYKLPVVSSKEVPIKIHSRTPGSTSFVPNVAGFYLASFVFNDIIKYRK